MMSNLERSLGICLCSDDFVPAVTGAGRHVQLLAKELVKRGHRVIVLTTRRPGQREDEVWEGMDVHRFVSLSAYGYYQALPSASAIERILTERSITIVHHHYLGFMMVQVDRAARRIGVPQVYTYHMPVDVLVQRWPMHLFRSWLSRKIVEYCNKFDLIVSPSINLVNRIRDEGVHTTIRHITNPVAFESDIHVAPVFRPAPFMVLFVGRLEAEKNIPFLLQAFRLFLDGSRRVGLWIAGTGSQRNRLNSYCRNLRIAEHVTFLGFVDHSELARYYAACDVFVLPSLVETQGLVAMEAMRFGKPVIVTRDIVAANELVEDGTSGFIVNSEKACDLAEKLVMLADDSALRRRLGQAAQVRSRGFAVDVVASAIESAYRAVLLERQGERDLESLNGA